MARWATCELNEIYVAGKSGGGLLQKGARVDLDAEISPGLTYEQALGDFAAQFTLESPPPAPIKGLPAEDDGSEEAAPKGRR